MKNDIRKAWSAQTSANPDEWTPQNRANGQCAVTALIVQDYFGGELLRVVNHDGQSHYYNLIDGVEIDLTRQQFESYYPQGPPEVREREYVLSFPETLRRYALLKGRLGVGAAFGWSDRTDSDPSPFDADQFADERPTGGREHDTLMTTRELLEEVCDRLEHREHHVEACRIAAIAFDLSADILDLASGAEPSG